MQKSKLGDILKEKLGEEKFRRFCFVIQKNTRLLYWQEIELISLRDQGYDIPLDFKEVKEQLEDVVRMVDDTPYIPEELKQLPSLDVSEHLIINKGTKKVTIYISHFGGGPELVYMENWLEKWKSVVRIAQRVSSGWEEMWALEVNEVALDEIPKKWIIESSWSEYDGTETN